MDARHVQNHAWRIADVHLLLSVLFRRGNHVGQDGGGAVIHAVEVDIENLRGAMVVAVVVMIVGGGERWVGGSEAL